MRDHRHFRNRAKLISATLELWERRATTETIDRIEARTRRGDRLSSVAGLKVWGRGVDAPDVSAEAVIRREQSAPARLSAADKRDEVALARDFAAATRDQDADARGVAFAEGEDADERVRDAHGAYGSDIVIRAAGQHQRDARHRAQAAEQDARADDDRRDAARDREQAAAERVHAFVDRELLATALAVTEVDALTGARTRMAGGPESIQPGARSS